MTPAQTSSARGGPAARIVHGYRLLGVIGRGGMATVYLARQSDLRRLVALKELGGLHATEPNYAKRFVREARVAASLSHPSIVTVHDFFVDDGTPYIAMEYVPGGTLRPQVGGLSLAQTAGMLESVLAGLGHAEQHGIVHRDIKPENLMVASDGRVKIADFGIAKATGALQTASLRTQTGTTIGTPNYMAPEQAMGQQVGPWTDLYSLGVVAFEMLVGRTPFYDSDSPMSMVFRHVNEPIPPVRELEPDVDPAVSDWIERLLEKDPASRPQSAAAAWDELEDAVIAALGARWRDHSRLVPAPMPELDTAAVAVAPGPVARTATTRLQGAAAVAPRSDTDAVTLPAAAATQAPAQGRHRPLVVLGVLVLLAIVAAAAAFAGGGSGGGSPTSPSSAPAQVSRASQPASPVQQPGSSQSSGSSSPPSGGPSSSSSPPSGGPSSSSSPPSGGPSSSSSPPSGGPSGESSGGAAGRCGGDSQSDDPSDDSCNGEP